MAKEEKRKVVECELCGLECTGREAGEHWRNTRHNSWTLLFKEVYMDTVLNEEIWECQNCGKRFQMDTYDGLVCDQCGGEIKKEPQKEGAEMRK